MRRFISSVAQRPLADKASVIAMFVVVGLIATPAWADIGLSGIINKINHFNTQLITLGGALALFGFIRALLSYFLAMGNLASAAVTIAVGTAIAAAPQIVSFFVSGVGI